MPTLPRPRRISARSVCYGALALLSAALLSVETAGAATQPKPAQKASWRGAKSGLPWASGASSGIDELEKFRGLKLDVRTVYMNRKNWAEMVSSASWVTSGLTGGAIPVVAVGLVPESHKGQLAQCAAGAFDGYIRQIGQTLVGKGAGHAALRLGWEANQDNFPWSATGDGSTYKGCFRRWVSILRSVPGQAFTIVWNMARSGSMPADKIYPGNDVVDVIGVQMFDRCPALADEKLWQANYNLTKSGSPAGLGAWLAYAKAKGKKLAVPEWGIGGRKDVCAKPGFDNAFFVQKMHAFFKANAADIAFEAYFNGDERDQSHKLSKNPKAGAAYKALWSLSAPPVPPPTNPPPTNPPPTNPPPANNCPI